MNSMLGIRSHPIRTVLGWQLLATVVVAVVAALLAGFHGAVSAALGGSISIVAGVIFAWVASRSKARSAGEALYAALRAEAIRIVVMLLLLWFVLSAYRDVVVPGLIGSFILTVLLFTMAIFVRQA